VRPHQWHPVNKGHPSSLFQFECTTQLQIIIQNTFYTPSRKTENNEHPKATKERGLSPSASQGRNGFYSATPQGADQHMVSLCDSGAKGCGVTPLLHGLAKDGLGVNHF